MTHTYYTITYRIFTDCLINHNYKGLVIKGQHTDEQLHEAWAEIYEQFQKNVRATNYTELVNAMRKYVVALQRFNILYEALLVLPHRKSEIILENLKGIGIKYKEPFNEFVESLFKKKGTFINAVKVRKEQFDKVQEQQESKTPTMQDYIDSLAAVSRFAGISLGMDVLLAEYVSHLNAMIDYSRRLESKEMVTKSK